MTKKEIWKHSKGRKSSLLFFQHMGHVINYGLTVFGLEIYSRHHALAFLDNLLDLLPVESFPGIGAGEILRPELAIIGGGVIIITFEIVAELTFLLK